MKSNIISLPNSDKSYAVFHNGNLMSVFSNHLDAIKEQEHLNYDNNRNAIIETVTTNKNTVTKKGAMLFLPLSKNVFESTGSSDGDRRWSPVICYMPEQNISSEYRPMYINNLCWGIDVYESQVYEKKKWSYVSKWNISSGRSYVSRAVRLVFEGPHDNIRHVIRELREKREEVLYILENIPDRVCECCKKKNKYQKYYKKRKPSYYTWGSIEDDGDEDVGRELGIDSQIQEMRTRINDARWVCSPRCGVKINDHIGEGKCIDFRFTRIQNEFDTIIRAMKNAEDYEKTAETS